MKGDVIQLCPACTGRGKVPLSGLPGWTTCPSCEGAKTVSVEPIKDRPEVRDESPRRPDLIGRRK